MHSIKSITFAILVLCNSWVFAGSLPDTIATVKKSVVVVGTYSLARSPKGLFLGTGFAIGDGSLIVTNAHVLPRTMSESKTESLAIFFQQQGQAKTSEVKIVAVDKTHDVAILKILSGTLPTLQINSKKVAEGQSVAFTGYPTGMVLGLYPVSHTGIVSAISPLAIPANKSRQINAKLLKRLRNPFDVYQLDATAYPGNSGSPVYNPENGQVFGVINKVFVKESKEHILSKPSGITYAIPIKYVEDLLYNYQTKNDN